ncbi:MAG: hypothetical protein A3I78_04010 [Gammaproteobacteria bacterium RIFCSPLOWO2_02_FULL_56_15]|nr:MAG: hypothetical protein A3I78_04010 [Gammaproteobacteria bacterium RIFCSPLOWO2_02_FULL_56_15]
MRNFKYILITLSLPCLITAQTVYRSVDKDGNMVFTDTPVEGAEEIKIKEVQTITLPALPVSSGEVLSTPAPEENPYTSLKIASPGNDEAIRDNTGNLNVIIEINPQLQSMHKLTLYLDGGEYASSSSTTFNLMNLDRGTHQLRVVVQDPVGKILTSTPSITFHILRAIVNQPGPGT